MLLPTTVVSTSAAQTNQAPAAHTLIFSIQVVHQLCNRSGTGSEVALHQLGRLASSLDVCLSCMAVCFMAERCTFAFFLLSSIDATGFFDAAAPSLYGIADSLCVCAELAVLQDATRQHSQRALLHIPRGTYRTRRGFGRRGVEFGWPLCQTVLAAGACNPSSA